MSAGARGRLGAMPVTRTRWEGDRALRVSWGASDPEAPVPLAIAVRYAARLSGALLESFRDEPQVLDVVASLEAVTVLLTADAGRGGAIAGRVRRIARTLAETVQEEPSWAADAGFENGRGEVDRVGRLIRIPVRYGGVDGPDLADVAERSGRSEAAVVLLHTQRVYICFAVGFRPGMPFLGPLDEGLVARRLDRPRLEVPAGSVAVAGRQTGIYPVPSPGGWQLLGRTEVSLFDMSRPDASAACLVHPGDRVRFEADPEGAVLPA